jgi:signal transduction histidine kinase
MVAVTAPAAPRALIYVVDDDPLVLASLSRLLELETPHEVHAFAGGEAALEAIRARPPELIITDLTMPQMDGLELLRRSRALAPDAGRVVLTGYADKESAIRAINEGGIFQYVEKPWDNAQLLKTVENAVEHVSLGRALQARNAELERAMRELLDAQERLVASERLAAVGRLASGIAHEIGNQLSLLGYAELVAERYGNDPEARELTDPLLAARRRLSSMVASIREFVRGAGTSDYTRMDQGLVPIVDEALSILRFEPALKLRRLTRSPNDETVRASLNREKLVQVVINLVRNAIQATREGGSIRVGVERRGTQAILEVADDGVGIAAENLERIWEPFFSTKGDAGTGLGLGICRRIVEEHGGRISVTSGLGKGATFTVNLPALSA